MNVTFHDIVESIDGLEDAWCRGLQAMTSPDRKRVGSEDATRIAGSVNIDAALRNRMPSEPRWDYVIGYRHVNRSGDVAYWVEVHPATSSGVGDVLRKLDWLKRWLRGAGAKLNALEKEFIWVSTGRTTFTSLSPQRKRLAQAGLRHEGRFFRIPRRR